MNRDRPQSLNGERGLGRGGHPGQPLTNRAQVGGGDGLLGEEPVEEPLIGQGLDQASVDSPGCAGLRNFDQGVAESLTFLDERPGLVPILGEKSRRSEVFGDIERIPYGGHGYRSRAEGSQSMGNMHAVRIHGYGGTEASYTRRLPDPFRRPPRC